VLPDGCDLNLLNGVTETAKSPVTDFQLKSAKSSEILLKICYLNMVKRNLRSYKNLIFRFAPALSMQLT